MSECLLLQYDPLQEEKAIKESQWIKEERGHWLEEMIPRGWMGYVVDWEEYVYAWIGKTCTLKDYAYDFVTVEWKQVEVLLMLDVVGCTERIALLVTIHWDTGEVQRCGAWKQQRSKMRTFSLKEAVQAWMMHKKTVWRKGRDVQEFTNQFVVQGVSFTQLNHPFLPLQIIR